MWRSAEVTTPIAAEPITLEQIKRHCRVELDENEFNETLTQFGLAARRHVEKICGMRFAEVGLTVQCDGFGDLARLSEAPLVSVTSIGYVDAAGAVQTLADTVYEAHTDWYEPSIALKSGQAWPAIRPGSRITLVGKFGGDLPADIRQAMLMLVAHWFNVREAVNVGNIVTEVPMGVMALLSNDRRAV